MKYEKELNKSYEVGFISKRFSYYWIAGRDTLDFSVNARQYEKDSTLHLHLNHKKPILFATALSIIKACLPKIKEDFDLTKLSSLSFRDPIYYFDIVSELSPAYEKQFGRKNISYDKLNDFLLQSNLNTQLQNFALPLNKEVRKYTIEKFHLTDKKYYRESLGDADLSAYPDFAINGMGLYVKLGDRP